MSAKYLPDLVQEILIPEILTQTGYTARLVDYRNYATAARVGLYIGEDKESVASLYMKLDKRNRIELVLLAAHNDFLVEVSPKSEYGQRIEIGTSIKSVDDGNYSFLITEESFRAAMPQWFKRLLTIPHISEFTRQELSARMIQATRQRKLYKLRETIASWPDATSFDDAGTVYTLRPFSDTTIRISFERNFREDPFIAKPHKSVELVLSAYCTDEVTKQTTSVSARVFVHLSDSSITGEFTTRYPIPNVNEATNLIAYLNSTLVALTEAMRNDDTNPAASTTNESEASVSDSPVH